MNCIEPKGYLYELNHKLKVLFSLNLHGHGRLPCSVSHSILKQWNFPILWRWLIAKDLFEHDATQQCPPPTSSVLNSYCRIELSFFHSRSILHTSASQDTNYRSLFLAHSNNTAAMLIMPAHYHYSATIKCKKMSAEPDTSSAFALLLSIDFKFVKNFREK